MINALTIAGTDPTGGAGVQADLKTFSALGAYGMSVMTALVAQNTQGVDSLLPVPLDFIEAQFNSVMDDVRVDTLKIGALINRDIVIHVADLVKRYPFPVVVLDTVMIAKGGHPLLEENAIEAIRNYMLPISTIITPNLPEAAALLGEKEADNEEVMIEQGRTLLSLGPEAVLIKGGHLTDSESPDYLITAKSIERFTTQRIKTKNSHGTGCTLSAAIAALYPRYGLTQSVEKAKEYLTGALANADRLEVGKGIGPTHHYYRWW